MSSEVRFPRESQGIPAEPGWPLQPRGPVTLQPGAEAPCQRDVIPVSKQVVDAVQAVRAGFSEEGREKIRRVLWPQSVTHLAGLFSLRRFNLLCEKCFLHPLRTDLSL